MMYTSNNITHFNDCPKRRINVNQFNHRKINRKCAYDRQASIQKIVLNSFVGQYLIVGEPKSRIVQKHTFFAPERYTAGILYTDSLYSA